MAKLKRIEGGYTAANGRFTVKDMNPAYRSTHPNARVMGPRWRITDAWEAGWSRQVGGLEDVREVIDRRSIKNGL